MIRKFAPLFILSFALLNACSSGGNSGGTTPPPPQSIVVTISSAPPASMMVGTTQGVSATVTNDSANAGVTWICTPSGSCGAFNPTSTASGAPTTFTAPSAVPGGNGAVVLIATSVTDKTKSAQSSPVTITAPPPPLISVSISQAPAATLPISGTTTVAATVTNDTAGVNWSCTPAGSCGTFNPTSTASTATTTYTAPSSVPTATGGKVTLTATSVTDPTKNAQSPILITGVASLLTLKGQYAFIVSAPTGNPSTRGITTWAGSINLDGNGNVLGGVEDISSPQYHSDPGDPILATVAGQTPTSHYTVDASGHGALVMLTKNGEILNMSFVVTSPTHAVVIELDGEPGSGTMDLQTPPSGGFPAFQLSGGYSFTMVGVDAGVPPPPYLSLGGTFSSNSSSGTAGVIDINTAGGMLSFIIISANISTAPDPNGRGVLNLVVQSPGITRQLFFYVVSPKVLRLVENDGLAFMGGSAYAQGSPGTTALSGNCVYQHSGWNPGTANPPTGRTVGAGQFSVASASNTFSSGFSDANTTNPSGMPATTGSAGLPVSNGSYTISGTTLSGTLNLTDAAGSSTFNMYMVDPTLNILDPNNSTGAGGALLLHTDTHINGTGILVPQQTATAFLGNYALNLNNSIAGTTPNELDLVGVLTGDGTSNLGAAPTVDLADYDQDSGLGAPNPMLAAPLSGTFAIDSGHPGTGRAVGTFKVNTMPGALNPYPFIPGATAPVTLNVAFYQVSNSEAFIVETDTQANVSGYLVLQQLP